jgi:hypothetical protein
MVEKQDIKTRGQNTIADGLSKAHLGAEQKQYWNTGE